MKLKLFKKKIKLKIITIKFKDIFYLFKVIMKIISWNVNGIRAVERKNALNWLKEKNIDIICLQETKALEEQVSAELKNFNGYDSVWHQGIPGYSGTVIYFNQKILNKKNQFKEVIFHEEGRMVEIELEKFVLLNIYFPNGGFKVKKGEQLTYKLNFYDKLIDYINSIGKDIIICGDFNIAHTKIDLARPQKNEESIGFLPVERKKFTKLIDNNYIDVFRYFYPEVKDEYTWWSYKTRARERNVGWRLDYFVVSPSLISKVKNIKHRQEISGSDHCPVFLEIF